MYEVPGVEGLSEVLIGEDVVDGTGDPVYQTVQEFGGVS